MNKVIIILTVLTVTWVFAYGLYTISENNKCTWVRVYSCKK